MKKRRTTLFLVLSFVLCLMLSACGSATSDTQASDAQGKSLGDRVLRDRALADAPTYDPFKTNDVETMLVHYQIFESCFFEAQDGSYQPAICESYEFNEAGDVLTMKIRDGVKFHNGSVVTPEDVAFSLNTAINSAYTAKVTSAMDYAEVVDGNVVLHLKFPYASAIGCLVSSNCAIVPKDVY
ncbi:MAG TPA: ABC transporter substrate-binding protein, partial [bacterium]|nr:ABC transporter substrate-binding protein [bacterium]